MRQLLFKSGPSKICRRQHLKNFTWPTLEYFVPYITNFLVATNTFLMKYNDKIICDDDISHRIKGKE